MGSLQEHRPQTISSHIKLFNNRFVLTMSSLKCLPVVLLLVIWTVNEIKGSVEFGSCENAGIGQTHHKCEMKCNFDGSCLESVSEESCGCDGFARFTRVTKYFQDGQGTYAVGKRRRKRQSSDVCNNMQARCRDCRGDISRSAYAEETEFDKYCEDITTYIPYTD